MKNALHVVILAAGQGTRMYSTVPKVLHKLAGKALLHHVLDTAISLEPETVHVVFGHGGEQVKAECENYKINWVHQAEQKGTGHAVGLALSDIPDNARVLVLYGDVPLLSADTLSRFQQTQDQIRILTAALDDPFGYGRILRQENRVIGIVEQKDASVEQLKINEINSGIMLAEANVLRMLLMEITSDNSQRELYLTDIVQIATEKNIHVDSFKVADVDEIQGINNKRQLVNLERRYQLNKAEKLLDSGVHLFDSERIDIRGSLICGKDVSIDINCVFQGDVELGDNVSIAPNCIITNSKIAAGTNIKANTIIEDSIVGENAIIGPFARLRPGAELSSEVHIGNFVEVKNSVVQQASKINHLSYVGDSDIGENVNIGAGTITCNYDGANKHRTVIGDDVFIGSGTELVAPVKVGNGATTGAGSTISKDIISGSLAVARAKQISIENWQRPSKKKSK